jgi:hypothetical protein
VRSVPTGDGGNVVGGNFFGDAGGIQTTSAGCYEIRTGSVFGEDFVASALNLPFLTGERIF